MCEALSPGSAEEETAKDLIFIKVSCSKDYVYTILCSMFRKSTVRKRFGQKRKETGLAHDINVSFSYIHCRSVIFSVNDRMMSEMRELQINRRMLGWLLTPLFLCLIAMGARVPNVTGPHAKPRPRAVIESSVKNSEDATVNQVVVAELCGGLPALVPPGTFRTTFLEENFQFTSTSLPQRDARAPPCHVC